MTSTLRVLALLLTLSTPALVDAQTNARIVVELTGVQAREGDIVCRLFDEAGWLDEDRARQITSPSTPRITFSPQPAGRYAVACFHDSDANGKLTFGLFWRPREGNGFSRGYRPFGPPKFDKAAFSAQGDTVVQVPLVYP